MVKNHRLTARVLRLGIVFSLLLFLGACTSTTFVYNRLDIILPWYVDDYVDLNREQKASLDEWLNPFFRWHRVDELPRYVQILQDIELSLDQSVTAEVVGRVFSSVEQAGLRLENEAMVWILRLGNELSEEQVQEFLAVLQEQQVEYEEEYLQRSEEEYQEDSYQSLADSLQDYVGRFDKDQRALLRDASAKLQRLDTPWLEERAKWLVNLNTLLQREPGWQRKLMAIKGSREDNYSPQYRAVYAHNLAVIQDAIATVIDSRSDKQDRRLRKKLKNLREDFETLIAQAESIQQ